MKKNEDLNIYAHPYDKSFNHAIFTKEANRLIFILPVWWNDTPAIIKGFIDKVMKKQFAYNVGATGVIGHLKNIQRVEVMTTLPHPPGI